MSEKRQDTNCDVEVENFDVFAMTLKKIMNTSPNQRGPAGRAIMAAFQVYYEQIGGAAVQAKSETK